MESLAKILTSEAFLGNIPAVCLLVCVLVILGRMLHIRIKTEHITIGGERREAYYERAIVREQTRTAHNFINALEQKINKMIPDDEMAFGGYRTKYILELVYDKTVDWITYNHLENSEAYLQCKYNEIDSLIYAECPLEQFRSAEFQERMHRWTQELIIQCINVRQLYSKQLLKGGK